MQVAQAEDTADQTLQLEQRQYYLPDSSPWPELQHLQLLGNGILLADVAQLCKGNWPQLNRLDLCNVFVNHQSHLCDDGDTIQCDVWKKVSGGSADPAFVQHLNNAGWPAVTQLRLHRCSLDLTGLKLLVTGQ